MKNGLSIIVRSESEFEKASEFIGKEYCYLKWVGQMDKRETAVVVWAKKKTNMSTGSVGCTENQRQNEIRTVEFSEFFKT
jgi:hypothetical protein